MTNLDYYLFEHVIKVFDHQLLIVHDYLFVHLIIMILDRPIKKILNVYAKNLNSIFEKYLLHLTVLTESDIEDALNCIQKRKR
jgi:hypothetical protein